MSRSIRLTALLWTFGYAMLALLANAQDIRFHACLLRHAWSENRPCGKASWRIIPSALN